MKKLRFALVIMTILSLALAACEGAASGSSAAEALSASFTVGGAPAASAISLTAGEPVVLGIDCSVEGYSVRFPDNGLVEADFVFDTSEPSKLDHIELTGLDAGSGKLTVIVEAEGMEPVTYDFDVTVAAAPASAPESGSSSEAAVDSAPAEPVVDSAPVESSSSVPASSSSQTSSSSQSSSSSSQSSSASQSSEASSEESSEESSEPVSEAPAAPKVTAANWELPDDYSYLDGSGYGGIANRLVDGINSMRAESNLPELTRVDILDYSSQLRADELPSCSDSEYSSHTRPDGSKWSTAFSELGITFYSHRGENLGRINFNGNSEDWALLIDGWRNSDAHRKNILDSQFQYVGVGVYQSTSGRYYICTHFAN